MKDENAKKLAMKFVGYMLAEINYSCKQGKLKTDAELTERFRNDYKTWKQLMMNSEEFTTLYASEVEKFIPKMRNNWK